VALARGDLRLEALEPPAVDHLEAKPRRDRHPFLRASPRSAPPAHGGRRQARTPSACRPPAQRSSCPPRPSRCFSFVSRLPADRRFEAPDGRPSSRPGRRRCYTTSTATTRKSFAVCGKSREFWHVAASAWQDP
jgi:hypothetical protein